MNLQANLDSSNKQEIMKLLANLNIQQGTTIIMVSHDTDAARHSEAYAVAKRRQDTERKRRLTWSKEKQQMPTLRCCN